MQGKIIGIQNCFTIFNLLIKTVEGLTSIPVDHRCFRNIIDCEGDIINRKIEYENKIIRFLNQEVLK